MDFDLNTRMDDFNEMYNKAILRAAVAVWVLRRQGASRGLTIQEINTNLFTFLHDMAENLKEYAPEGLDVTYDMVNNDAHFAAHHMTPEMLAQLDVMRRPNLIYDA